MVYYVQAMTNADTTPAELSPKATRFMKRWGAYFAAGKHLTFSRNAKATIRVCAELQQHGLISAHAHYNKEIRIEGPAK